MTLEENRESQRKFRREHPDYHRRWREANRDRILEARRQRRKENPEKYRQEAKKRYWANPEKERERYKNYRRRKPIDQKKNYEAVRSWRQNSYGKLREQIWRKLGFTLTYSNFLGMILEQGGVCAVCKRGVKLVADHDHVTGRARRPICYGCNSALGHARESRAVLFALAEYLESHGS